MSELRIRLFGHFEVLHGDRPASAPVLRKGQELLALVLLAPQRTVRRGAAVNALWPDAESATSRKAMRQALWQIHLAADTTPQQLRTSRAWCSPTQRPYGSTRNVRSGSMSRNSPSSAYSADLPR